MPLTLTSAFPGWHLLHESLPASVHLEILRVKTRPQHSLATQTTGEETVKVRLKAWPRKRLSYGQNVPSLSQSKAAQSLGDEEAGAKP
jgi:hypothetical protein